MFIEQSTKLSYKKLGPEQQYSRGEKEKND